MALGTFVRDDNDAVAAAGSSSLTITTVVTIRKVLCHHVHMAGRMRGYCGYLDQLILCDKLKQYKNYKMYG